MNMSERSVFQIKLLICAVVVSAGITFMVGLLWPQLSTITMALYVLGGWAILGGLFLLLVVNSAVGSWLNQWILRKGGTDTQWLWFSADPPGLERDAKPKQH
jgi:hypothetical protein